jgi:hypothetical protein
MKEPLPGFIMKKASLQCWIKLLMQILNLNEILRGFMVKSS